MRRIALASCSLWPDGSGDHAGLVEALGAHGAQASWVPWDDPDADWSQYDLVVLRETWDYPPKLESFLDWVDAVASVTAVVNPPAVVRWNHHKRYLLELAARGVRTVPTTVVTRSDADPAAALRAADRATVVVKPAVGIGGNEAARGRADDPATAAHLHAVLAGGDALVQPYIEGIESRGETSVVMMGGRVSHAVAKVPAQGEFRIHEHRGGRYAQVEPAPAFVALALEASEAARAITGEGLLYARADMVASEDGRLMLMELELIEPSLYLHTVPAATEQFAGMIIGLGQ